MIRIERITKTYDTDISEINALSSVSIDIPEGKIVSLIGPSGCGKSTLLKIIAGIEKPTSGSVELNGKKIHTGCDVNRNQQRKRFNPYHFISSLADGFFRNGPRYNIAMVSQDSTVFPWMSVLENCTFVLSLRGINTEEAATRSIRLLSRMGLESNLQSYPRELSGGMLQRLALAQALVVEPEILLLDEPFASVDSFIRAELQDLLLELLNDTRITIILVTHDIGEAVYLSDTVAVLSAHPGTVIGRLDMRHLYPRMRRSPELDHARSIITNMMSGVKSYNEEHQNTQV